MNQYGNTFLMLPIEILRLRFKFEQQNYDIVIVNGQCQFLPRSFCVVRCCCRAFASRVTVKTVEIGNFNLFNICIHILEFVFKFLTLEAFRKNKNDFCPGS